MASNLAAQHLPKAQTSLGVDKASHCWLVETALFLPGQDTWGEPEPLAVAHTDMLQCPCGVQQPLVAWRLDSRAQKKRGDSSCE